ncbi:MAG: hypothetical protein KDK06_20695 [Gammaproteobacteria bacterium]|nr:hypothetical protein [Gammaproteobacteria bacterium]
MSISCKLSATFAATAILTAAPAQCAFSAVMPTVYGQSCSTYYMTAPSMMVGLDTANCALDIAPYAYRGPGSASISASVLVLGLSPAAIAVPVAPGCLLLATPDIVLFQSVAPGSFLLGNYRLSVAGLLPPFTVHAQAAAIFSQAGVPIGIGLSGGMRLDLL